MHTRSLATRRRLVTALALVAWLPDVQAQAQNKLERVGLFGLLGDSMQVVVATDAPSDTRIERSARQSLDVKDVGFDMIALRQARDGVLKAAPQAQVNLYRASGPLSLDEQRSVAEGAGRGELPAWIVQTIEAKKLSHVILLTRTSGEPNIRTGDGNGIGRGTVQGIGFYIDTLYPMRNPTTGAQYAGLIGPYVQVRLTLMDTQTAAVLGSYDIREGRAVGWGGDKPVADPWTFLSSAQKVTLLREMLQEGVARAMPELLKAP